MSGNGPVNTSPLFASDETLIIRLRGDFWTLATASDQMAFGVDGVIAPGDFWTMTSASIDFSAQGLQPQQVMKLSQPTSAFPGGGKWYAIDAVSPNTVVLRMVNRQNGIGQAPAPAAGLTNITFQCSTFQSLIEDATWDIKSRFSIDEAIYYRSSAWMYQGVEDAYRDERAATVLQVMYKAYQLEDRGQNNGDFMRKASKYKAEHQEVIERLQVRWGNLGNSAEPSSVFSCKIAR